MNQSIVNRFILKHPSNVTRAFLGNFIEFYNLRDIKVPKRTGRTPRKKKESISPKEMEVLRAVLYDDHTKFGLLLDISYFCALRKSEALGIIAENFAFKKWREDETKPCRLKVEGKGLRERYVIIPPRLAYQIALYINSLDYLEAKQLLFKGVSRTTWTDHFKRAVRKYLKKDYTLHDLRRSRATNWYKKDPDLMKIKTRLGHASISTTQLYINPDEEKVLKEWEDEY